MNILSKFSIDDILFIDNYSNADILVYKFKNIFFRTELSHFHNFQCQLAVDENKKIINISNRQFSFLYFKYKHYIGGNYMDDIKNTFDNIKKSMTEKCTIITELVFLFFDYDSVNGIAHSHDLMFYLLYHYKYHNLAAKLLVVNTTNKYYNNFLELIKKYYNVEFIYINMNETYLINNFYCIRTYQNILFPIVKNFINETLINPIINNFDNLNKVYYANLLKIKYKDIHNLHNDSSFEKDNDLINFLNNNNIYDLNVIDDIEYTIYLLNMAKNIIISCGSIYYININYYLKDTQDKNIFVIFHKNLMSEKFMFSSENEIIKQNMPFVYLHGLYDNIYNMWNFKGKIIYDTTVSKDFIYQINLD